jgi:phosphoribosylglycinamide formyltransferase 1
MLRIGVLASGKGSNLQAIIDCVKAGTLGVEIGAVISDKREARALERARTHRIDDVWVNPKEFKTREDYDRMLVQVLKNYSVDLVVLAGFMRILSPVFVREFPGRIINIHPALLPKYPGTHSIEKAFKAGDRTTGVTVHFVDDGVDTGPIIKQVQVPILPDDTLEKLEERVHEAEHRLYPEVIRLFSEEKISVSGRNVKVRDF